MANLDALPEGTAAEEQPAAACVQVPPSFFSYNDFFCQNLSKFIEANNISLNVLCLRSNISRPYLGKLVAGKASPSLDIMGRLADGLGVPLSTLLEAPDTMQLGVPEGFKRIPSSIVPADFNLDEHTAVSGKDASAALSAAPKPSLEHGAPALSRNEDPLLRRQQDNANTLLLMKIMESQNIEERYMLELRKLMQDCYIKLLNK